MWNKTKGIVGWNTGKLAMLLCSVSGQKHNVFLTDDITPQKVKKEVPAFGVVLLLCGGYAGFWASSRVCPLRSRSFGPGIWGRPETSKSLILTQRRHGSIRHKHNSRCFQILRLLSNVVVIGAQGTESVEHLAAHFWVLWETWL